MHPSPASVLTSLTHASADYCLPMHPQIPNVLTSLCFRYVWARDCASSSASSSSLNQIELLSLSFAMPWVYLEDEDYMKFLSKLSGPGGSETTWHCKSCNPTCLARLDMCHLRMVWVDLLGLRIHNHVDTRYK